MSRYLDMRSEKIELRREKLVYINFSGGAFVIDDCISRS